LLGGLGRDAGLLICPIAGDEARLQESRPSGAFASFQIARRQAAEAVVRTGKQRLQDRGMEPL
jgi:hypothetical protein